MKKQFFIANWKSHKTEEEARDWFVEVAADIHLTHQEEREVVICPPSPLLHICKAGVNKQQLSFKIGAQDISSFPEGAYTGEVSGRLLKDLASYVIIGHSERRRYLHETDEMLSQKVQQAKAYGLEVVYCVESPESVVPEGVQIVAYEPPTAIGTGHPANPEDVERVAGLLKAKNDVLYVLYGGSVTADDIADYTQLPSIDGVLVGGASLTPKDFISLIQHA